MDVIDTIALTMGVAWASGINLYATVFMLGYLSNSGNIVLPPEMAVVTDPLVMTAAGFMYCVEFFADKTPGVDTVWDGIHSFIRIPAGAMLAAAAVGDTSPAVELAALLIGGGITTSVHATKTGSRMLINTSPEPFSNWTASVVEDLAVIGGLWAALHHPWLFVVLFIAFVLLLIWLLPKIWRGLKAVFRKIASFFDGGDKTPPPREEPPPPLPPLPPGNSDNG